MTTTCLLCETNKHTKIKFNQNFSPEDLTGEVFSARRSTEHYHYQILECQTCGSVFSSPILPYEKIAGLYKTSKQNYDDETSFINESYIAYINQNNALFKNREKALEIGCGSGFFLRALQKTGYKEVAGVEPSEEAVSKSGDLKDRIFTGFFEETNYAPNSFDLVTCFQTLDHLIDPFSVLKKIHEVLKPGGIAYLIMHNEKSLQAKFFGEKSPIYDVEHIYLFNKETLSRFVKKAGFNIMKLFDIKNIYPLSYWLRMAPIPMKKSITFMAKAMHLMNVRIGIYPGNIGIFIQKPE